MTVPKPHRRRPLRPVPLAPVFGLQSDIRNPERAGGVRPRAIDERTGVSCTGGGTQTATKCLRDRLTLRSHGEAGIPEKRAATVACLLGPRDIAAYRYEHRD